MLSGTSPRSWCSLLPRQCGAAPDLAWAVLEELALCAQMDGEGLVASASVRSVAAAIGVGKDASAKALTRLAELGLIRHETYRNAGRYAESFYRFDLDACRQAGLLLTTSTRDGTRPETPCPAKRDTHPPSRTRNPIPPPRP